MLIVGTVIGAGFVSGQELVSFFGSNASPLTAVMCGVVFFIVSALFMGIGSHINSDNLSVVNSRLIGKGGAVLDIVLLVNSFIVLAGMLSGMGAVGQMFGLPTFVLALVGGVVAMATLCSGKNALLSTSKIVVPIIIVLLVVVCIVSSVNSGGIDIGGEIAVTTSVAVYVCMNMMLASTVLTTIGKVTRKEIVLASGIASIVMGVLIFMVMSVLASYNYEGDSMPVLAVAKQISPLLYGLIVIVVIVSIFTTMLTALSSLVSWFCRIFGNKFFSCIVVLLLALSLANLGFSRVVGLLYPLIGVLGVFYTILALVYTCKHSPLSMPIKTLFDKRNTKVHNARKDT